MTYVDADHGKSTLAPAVNYYNCLVSISQFK